MANRLKEDEKNERIIRGLLKLPANKKCINCNSLGPQYACTNFWTFICTNCSGIHREFTHRVKSISMAKFTSQEVTALQEGGNERAKEIYFKEWDPQCHSLPDSSNVERLRTFIKHVYVDRRYTGERTADRPPRVKSDREGYEQRKTDDFRGASRSPPYDETYDRRYGERPGSGGRYDDRNFRQNYEDRRSPGYDQGDYRRSPRFDVVDDRRQDEKYGRVNQNQRFEDRRFSDGVRKPEGSSPNYQKDMGSPPVIRPVREILGDDAPTLRVGEPPKSNGGRVAEIPPPPHVVPPPEQVAPPLAQVTAPARSLSPTNGKPTEVKNAKADSLIDFDADPEPSVTEAPNQSVARQTTSPPANGDWASFDSVTEPKAPQVAASLNPLDSDLTLLSAFGDASGKNPSALSASGTDLSSINTAGQWPTAQQNQPALFSVAGSQATSPPFTPSSSGSQGSQSWAPSAAQNVSGSLTASAGQTSQSSNPPTIGTSSGVSPEVKHSGRKELPADLFAALYPTQHASMMGWQARPSFGMGFAMQMQYPPAVQPVAPPFQYPSKSANPFDTSNEPTLAHASTFPSLVPLQGALPNPPNSTGLLRSSSFGATPFSQMMPQHLPPNPLAGIPGGHIGQQFPSNIPQQIPSNMSQQFRSNIPQQIPSNMFAMGNQQIGMDHNSNARYSQPSTPSFPPAGGNPFG